MVKFEIRKMSTFPISYYVTVSNKYLNIKKREIIGTLKYLTNSDSIKVYCDTGGRRGHMGNAEIY